jgi:hypothetical protein
MISVVHIESKLWFEVQLLKRYMHLYKVLILQKLRKLVQLRLLRDRDQVENQKVDVIAQHKVSDEVRQQILF